jgi:hypothetical protein
MMDAVDVAVVGRGPGGSCAAMLRANFASDNSPVPIESRLEW